MLSASNSPGKPRRRLPEYRFGNHILGLHPGDLRHIPLNLLCDLPYLGSIEEAMQDNKPVAVEIGFRVVRD